MKLLSALLLLLIFLTSSQEQKEVSPELKPFKDMFLEKVKSKCAEGRYNNPRIQTITFQKLESPTVGVCMRVINGFRIFIDEEYFKSISYSSQKVLLFHEFTHCYLGKYHEEDASHYMYPKLIYISEKDLDDQLDEYLTRMCN